MKRNIFNFKWSIFMMMLIGAMQLSVTSCSDDDSTGGTPEITAVRVPDPAKADSTFTKSGPGQVIAIIGKNLDHTLKVYINDQEVYFNPMMNTDHSVIVTVPSEADGFKLTAFNSELKDEIRVETTHGTATYAFKITAPYPSISQVKAGYPRETGDSLYLYGLNLVDVEKIYFTDIESAQLDSTVWETPGGNHVDVTDFKEVLQDHHLNKLNQSYETSSVLGLVVPELGFEKGTLVVECAAGTTYVGFYKYPGQPVISYLSSEMPVRGEKVVIRGLELVDVQSITYGDVTVPYEDITQSDTYTEVSFIFDKEPALGCKDLTLTTSGGSVSVPFYNYACMLFNFDDYGTDLGWSPAAEIMEVDEEYPPYSASGQYASFDIGNVAQQWWGTMVYFIREWGSEFNGHNLFILPSYDVIPTDASTKDIYLACEIFNNNTRWDESTAESPKNAYIRYYIHTTTGELQYDNGFDWEDYNLMWGKFAHPVLCDIDNQQPQREWYRHVVSLDDLGFKGTYADVVAAGLDEVRMQIINQSTVAMKVSFFMDNVRLYYRKPGTNY